jgi:hypothetical protein
LPHANERPLVEANEHLVRRHLVAALNSHFADHAERRRRDLDLAGTGLDESRCDRLPILVVHHGLFWRTRRFRQRHADDDAENANCDRGCR